MSQKERTRLGVMQQIRAQQLTVMAAAGVLALSYRQAKRVWRRYRVEGDAGLVHRGRGRPSNRAKAPSFKGRVLARYRERYPDFGPTLACEHLAREGLRVDHESLRRWWLAAGAWSIGRRRQKHRQWRERKPCFGQLVQMDGSHHDWFEGRAEQAVLMVMIDDATNTTLARFYPAEDTAAAYDIFERYVRLYGLPVALYPDRDSIYVCTREACLEEQLANVGPETQFARAMRELGVDLIPAHSPQAKGRVERRHGLFQDRLIKEMRLLSIRTIEAANAFLDGTFLPLINGRYTVKPNDPVDGHRPRPLATTLDLVLSWQESRCVAKDWTLVWHNRRLQIDARHAALGLPGRRVMVVERRNGTLTLCHGRYRLTFRDAPAPAIPVQRPSVPRHRSRTVHVPAIDHPWRRSARVHFPVFRPPPTSYIAHSRGAENQAAVADGHLLPTS